MLPWKQPGQRMQSSQSLSIAAAFDAAASHATQQHPGSVVPALKPYRLTLEAAWAAMKQDEAGPAQVGTRGGDEQTQAGQAGPGLETTLSPAVRQLQRIPSLAASSDSEITYVDLPTTSRPFVPRAPSPAFVNLPAGPSNQPDLPPSAGLPPSAFALPPPLDGQPTQPVARRPLLSSRSPSASNRLSSLAPSASQLQAKQPTSTLGAAPNPLLAAFLEADRAVKENVKVPAKRTRSRIEEWREEVGEAASRDGGVEAGASGGGSREGETEEAAMSESVEEEEAVEDDLVNPAKIGQQKRQARRQPSSSPPPPSKRIRASPPAAKPGKKSKKPTAKKGKTAPTAASSPPAGSGSGSGSGAGGKSSDRDLKTRDLVAMLPKRRKTRAVKARPDSGSEERDESEAETDYELFSSPRRRRPAAHMMRPSTRKTGYGANAGSPKKGKKVRENKAEEDENDSDVQEKKEAARRKWAAVDDYEVETWMTL